MSSSLNQIIANSLWFAFDALDQHKTGVVNKGRLKELTKQIGETLYLDRSVENCLSDYRSTDTLTFDQYLHFLEYEVFSDVCKRATPYSEVERYHAALDALFWEVGRHSLAPRYPVVLSLKDTFKVFRVFCILADRTTAAGGDLVQVSVRRSEVCEVCRHLVDGLGLDWDWADWQMVSGSISNFPLPVFLTFIEGRYGQSSEASALSASIENVYRFFVGQVFFKGKAYQRITRAGGWLRRDIEVVPWCLRSTVDTNEDCPAEGGPRKPPPAQQSPTTSPNKILTNAVERSLTLGRSAVGATGRAVGAVGGKMKTGVNEVMERSRTLKRTSTSPKKTDENKPIGPGPKRVFSLGRWGSTSGINKKRNKAVEKDTASLGGGRESPSPKVESKRSHTLERTPMKNRSDNVSTASGDSSAKSPDGKAAPSPIRAPLAKDSTKGVVGGVIGKVWRLEVTPETEITSLKDTASGRACQVSIVSTPTSRPIIVAASDHKSKARLIAALQEAVKHCRDSLPYQMRVSASRRNEEEEQSIREDEERVRRSSQADIIEQTQAELAAERSAREEAESLAHNESVARAAEEERVQELTTLRQQLEALLEQEKNAKRDEEIVRNLQARVLREEWAKREELEKLQEEQQQLLEEEQRKRRAFEILQKEQEKKLREAESRLKSLDGDRRRLDEELRAAREKIVMSGRGKQLLEAKMKVQEGRRPPIRTLSLKPSRQERASPARSSSFTTPPTRLGIPSPTTHSKPLPGSAEAGMTKTGVTPSVLLTSGSPSTSASSTPASTPSGANPNRSILDALENGMLSSNGNSPIKSIPEQKGEEEETETIGWNVSAPEKTNGSVTESKDTKSELENGGTNENSDEDNAKEKLTFIEIKTYEDNTMPVDLIGEASEVTKTITKAVVEGQPEAFDLLSEIDAAKSSVTSKTVVTTTATNDDGSETTVTKTIVSD